MLEKLRRLLIEVTAKVRPRFRKWWWFTLVEWQRQVIDQFLHVSVGASAVWFFAKWMALSVAVLVVAAVWVYREIDQWPSTRWYDPPLDWFFEFVGLALGYWWVIT